MKESFTRLTAWAKAHPYLAGGLLIAVIVLAWIAIKRGGGSGGASGFSQEAADPVDASTPLGSSDLANLGSPAPGDQTPATIPAPSTDGAGNTTSSAGGNFDNLAGIDPMSYEAISPTSYAIAGGLPVSSVQSTTLMQEGERVKALEAQPIKKGLEAPKSAAGLGVASGGVSGQTANRSTSSAKTDAEKIGKGPKFSGLVNGVQYVNGMIVQARTTPSTIQNVIAKSPSLASAKKPTIAQTPAEKLGLYKYYSGYYGGITYLLGYPVITAGTTGGGTKKR